jgi:hypothetical protein
MHVVVSHALTCERMNGTHQALEGHAPAVFECGQLRTDGVVYRNCCCRCHPSSAFRGCEYSGLLFAHYACVFYLIIWRPLCANNANQSRVWSRRAPILVVCFRFAQRHARAARTLVERDMHFVCVIVYPSSGRIH